MEEADSKLVPREPKSKGFYRNTESNMWLILEESKGAQSGDAQPGKR